MKQRTVEAALILPQYVKAYVLAGQAVVTLKSELSGKHYTYKVFKKADKYNASKFIYFVSVLIGPDEYLYKGMIGNDGKYKSYNNDTPSRAFKYMWDNVNQLNRMPTDMTILHQGRCGHCGKVLTNPESILSGIGPVCAGKE